MISEKIVKAILANKERYLNGNYGELAAKFGVNYDQVRWAARMLRKGDDLKTDDGPTDFTAEMSKRAENAALKSCNRKYESLLAEYQKLNELYDNALLIKHETSVSIPKILAHAKEKEEAVAIVQYSDWHVEELIEKTTTQGLNQFNPEIAALRAKKLATNTIKLVRKERQDVKISNLILCLGGDFINNYLHEHDVQMNTMSPIEATLFAKSLLKEALLTLATHGKFDRITVLCVRGNHPRLTKRMQSSNDYKMNLEAVLYYMLKQELNDSVFDFHIPESEMGYLEAYNKTIRYFHGHQIRFQGGIGGITIPLHKAIMRWDDTHKADFNLMHHYHQLSMPVKTVSINGSLCGYNSYALSNGFKYEPPLQSFQILDKNRGFTVRTPIFCE